jgi:glycine dehydrogenase
VLSPWKDRPGNPTSAGSKAAPVSAAPFGSATILLISWVYIALMGAEGLERDRDRRF